MSLAALRTPDHRFADLPDWPYAPRYVDNLPGYVGLRAHYIDEGPRDARHTFLCLHGEPSWAYLYRRMIPAFLAAGGRVVAPDLLGFGRSDKPVDDAVYTTTFHRDFLLAFIERLELQSITLVIQDWGGLLGLTLPLALGPRIARVIVMNTTFAVGADPSPGFAAWRAFAARSPDMDVGLLIARGTPHLTPAEIAAYNAPFPDIRYKAGVRRFPQLVPTAPEQPFAELSRAARDWWRTQWRGPTFAAIGMADPVLGPDVMAEVLAHIPGAPAPLEIEGGGHFVQEWGERIATAALAHFGEAA
ncbi:MAG: alpha/beta fold hydrolase [Alphaproteobacteria bacterium]|nr:alpha/beta fold hydrolase [Alphaproteobacteria bacterium]